MTDKLELSLLGPVAITLDGEPVSGHVPAKSQALQYFLAATGLPHDRERLAGLLWGDNPEARANLRKILSNLRQLFGDALIVARQTVAFDRDNAYPFGRVERPAIASGGGSSKRAWSSA